MYFGAQVCDHLKLGIKCYYGLRWSVCWIVTRCCCCSWLQLQLQGHCITLQHGKLRKISHQSHRPFKWKSFPSLITKPFFMVLVLRKRSIKLLWFLLATECVTISRSYVKHLSHCVNAAAPNWPWTPPAVLQWVLQWPHWVTLGHSVSVLQPPTLTNTAGHCLFALQQCY